MGKPGTRLFDAYTQATPTSDYELIGDYEVTGSFSTTKFGDDALFFKHQYMEEDFQVHPEWLGQINKGVQCGMDAVSTKPPRETQGCSAPFSRRAAPALSSYHSQVAASPHRLKSLHPLTFSF